MTTAYLERKKEKDFDKEQQERLNLYRLELEKLIAEKEPERQENQ